jgi:hypothetical protein
MPKYWYEVFVSSLPNGETRTIHQCNTLKEARTFLKEHKIACQLAGETLHIDKWVMRNGTPDPIKEIK